jgi:hypothetical protein
LLTLKIRPFPAALDREVAPDHRAHVERRGAAANSLLTVFLFQSAPNQNIAGTR